MKTLLFRTPGPSAVLREVLALAWPRCSDRQVREALRSGAVRVGRRVETDGDRRLLAGLLVRADVPAGELQPQTPELSILARGEDYCVVDKPAGWPSHAATPSGLDARSLAASRLGRPLDAIWPAHRLDAEASGAWLIALTKEAAARLSLAFAEDRVEKEYRALARKPAWPRGTLTGPIDSRPAVTRFCTVRDLGPVAELALTPVTGRTHQLRKHLAAADSPLLGDSSHGGLAVAGGLRLYSKRIAIESEGIDVVLAEPRRFALNVDPARLFPATDEPAELVVSTATMLALQRGHPWVLTDSETSDLGGYRPGTAARVRGPSGEEAGIYRIEGTGRVAARRWSRPGAGDRPDEIHRRVRQALERRRELLAELETTNAFRLIHGEADRLPGLAVDLLAGQLRVLLLSRSAEGLVEPVLDALQIELRRWLPAPPAAVLVTHLRAPVRGELLCVQTLRGEPAAQPFWIRERGLEYEVSHGLDEPYRSRPGVGLYLDQRQNRERIAGIIGRLAPGRWLNLFAHTGGFTLAALSAGAELVVSVDLSRSYLARLDRNLARNRLPAKRHQGMRMDARRYLERLDPRDRFAGIILDPPTAAATGKRFWSLRKQLSELIGLCLQRLAPGGHLLVCRNDQGARRPLSKLIDQTARETHVPLAKLEPAGPGPDFPSLKHFPEGQSFEGLLIRLPG